MWQVAELPVESLPARVFLAGVAPAITPPIAERLDDALERRLLGEDRPALSHGDMVRRVEAHRREVTECGDGASAVPCADGVATVLDEEEVVLSGELRDGIEVERVA